jgi:hypothetical protein
VEHHENLVQEHEAHEVRVHKSWTKANERARKELDPIEREHEEIVRSLTTILSRVPGQTPNAVPAAYNERPYPIER